MQYKLPKSSRSCESYLSHTTRSFEDQNLLCSFRDKGMISHRKRALLQRFRRRESFSRACLLLSAQGRCQRPNLDMSDVGMTMNKEPFRRDGSSVHVPIFLPKVQGYEEADFISFISPLTTPRLSILASPCTCTRHARGSSFAHSRLRVWGPRALEAGMSKARQRG